jgi:outer membrane autotransporter protein
MPPRSVRGQGAFFSVRIAGKNGLASRWAGRSGLAVAAAAALFCLSAPASALLMVLGNGQPLTSATWNNSGASDFGDPLNWTPNSSVPNFVATFTGMPAAPVVLPNYMDGAVQTISFASNAGAYTIQTALGFTFTIGEIVNASANVQTFEIINSGALNFGDTTPLPSNVVVNVTDGSLTFFDGANAGNATINVGNLSQVTVMGDISNGNATATLGNANVTNFGFITFLDSSAGNAVILNSGTINFFFSATAANATFTNDNTITFNDNSTAANATFTNNAGASIIFNDATTAGNATFTNDGTIRFRDTSTAANATFTNNSGNIQFFGTSTAANATFTNNGGSIQFNNNSTAAFATITNDGTLQFNNDSTAANATILNDFSGTLQFTSNATAGFATITNYNFIQFFQDTTAGNATIENNGNLIFYTNATAGFATITNNCCLTFNDASTAGNATIYNFGPVTFGDNSTAGSSTITNNGFSQLFFLGNSTAANAAITNDENGFIAFADSATAGNATIRNSGIIEFNNNSSAGNATITINPTGAVAFFGNSTAANSIIVNSSAFPTGLIFADNATAGDATITTTAGAYTLFVDNSTGGNARFITTGNGIVDFAEPFGGAIRTAGSIEGTGIFIIGGTTLTVGSNNLSTTVDGIIVDFFGCGCANPSGNLIKIGAGTLTLNGVNTYTGFTEVQSGALFINGSIASFLTTANAGTILGGNGTISGDVFLFGMIAPGATLNSIGTLRIDGHLSINGGSLYRADIASAANRDFISVGGNAIVWSGAAINVVAAPFTNIAPNDRIAVVTGATSLSGQFDTLVHNFLFYDVTLDSDANNIYLVFTRNAQTFAPLALTPNQRAVAAALDAAGANNLIGASFQNTSEAVRAVLDLLSGELYATMAGTFIDESAYFRNAIFARLRNTAFSGFAGTLGYLSEQDEQALAYTGNVQANPFRALRPVDRGVEYWAQAFGSWAKYQSDSNAGDAKRATGGIVAGLDKMLLDGIRAGLSVGYSNTTARITDRASKANADTFHFAAYLSKLDGRWSYRTGAAAALHNVDSERNIIGDTLRANYFAFTGQIFGEVAYAMTAGQFAVEPFVNLALVHHHTNGFTETGANSALTTDGIDKTLGFSTIGMRFATRYNLANGQVLIPRFSAAWQHAFGNLTPTATLTFQSTGTGMTIAGTPLARDMLLTETGFDVRIAPNRMLGLFYSATVAQDSVEHALRGKYEWRF